MAAGAAWHHHPAEPAELALRLGYAALEPMVTELSTEMSRPGRSLVTMILAGAAGIALYAAAAYFSFMAAIPGTDGVFVRPGFAVLPFFGMAFGPVVGFVSGFGGNALADQLTGWGALSSPPWHVANGMVGLIAALLTQRLGKSQMWTHSRLELSAAIGVVATATGFLVVFAELVTQGLPFGDILMGSTSRRSSGMALPP